MKRRVSIVIVSALLLVVSALVSACGDASTTTTHVGGSSGEQIVAINTVTSAQSTVYALAGVQPSGDIPAHFTAANGDFVRNPDDFDVNAYFTVLTHLSVEPGWVVDYLYQMDGLGGHPFLYPRPSGQAPYASRDAYEAATPIPGQNPARADRSRDYLDHIQIDDTREGYFQFVTLTMIGDQFYLHWHAGYNDTTPVCDNDALERTMTAAGAAFEGHGLPADVQKQARKLELVPTVDFSDGATAIVRVVTFSKWGGFIERKYTISRDFPHRILAEESKTLVEYDCGVQF